MFYLRCVQKQYRNHDDQSTEYSSRGFSCLFYGVLYGLFVPCIFESLARHPT
jgi:hypothetical protein